MSGEDDDDPVALSPETLAVLDQFLKEKNEAEESRSKDPFAEDWGMSQVFSLSFRYLTLPYSQRPSIR